MKAETYFAVGALIGLALLSGCVANSAYDRGFVSSELQTRAGSSLEQTVDSQFNLPDSVLLNDGLGEDEAVAIALWNNASLQVSMAQLGVARADLASAGAFPNPVLGLLFPESPARYEATLALPIDLLSRHSRVNVAREEVERVAAMMVAQGLDLARDVRIAHAQAVVAEQQQSLLQEQAALSADIVGIAAVQFETGKISEQAYATQRAQSAELSLLATNAVQAALVQRYRLHELLGLDDASVAQTFPLTDSQPRASAMPALAVPDLQSLLDTALKSRPELLASEADVQRAGYQAKWERNKLLNFIAQLKLEKSNTDSSTSPGVQFELPLFNQNQGGRSRAEVQLEQAAQGMLATQHAIRREVGTARASYVAAQEAYALLNNAVLPALQSELAISRQAYGLGRQSYLDMAQVQLRNLQAQSRAAEAQLTLRNATAQLAHSLGQQPRQQLRQPVAATSAGALQP